MLSKICLRTVRNFSKFRILSEHDVSNMVGLVEANPKTSMTIWEKISSLSPSSVYHTVDQFSRQALFTLANDYQLGIPLSIVLISALLRVVFFYPNFLGQIMALKMKKLQKYMSSYKQKLKVAQMSKNTAMLKQAQNQFAQVRKKNGIDNFYSLLNLIQIPFVITWFISLRYVTTMPEIFPQIKNGFLWIDDLSSYDPYFILPVLAAFISSYSIMISPSIKNASSMNPLFAPIAKYMKYFPFLALPFTSMFPAAINLYWVTFSFSQLGLIMLINTKWVQKKYEIIKERPISKIEQAVFIDEKEASNIKISPQLMKDKPEKIEQIQILLKKKGKKSKKTD